MVVADSNARIPMADLLELPAAAAAAPTVRFGASARHASGFLGTTITGEDWKRALFFGIR